MAENSLKPRAMAWHTAVLSAQMVKPSEAFSTLQPEMISPDLVSSAAPTWNFE